MSLLLLLLDLFLLHSAVSHGSPLPSSTYDGSPYCPKSHCGKVEISYPFSPSNISDYCGYTYLRISCQDQKTPTIQLGEGNYTVNEINYNNSTIVLADTDVFSGSTCPRIRHSARFDPEQMNYTGSYDNVTFFFGCKSSMPNSFPPDIKNNNRIKCDDLDPSTHGLSFVFRTDAIPEVFDYWKENCNDTVVVPVSRDAQKSDWSVFTWGKYGGVLKQGFELVWNRSTDDSCYQCEEQSKGQCTYNQAGEFLNCLCSDGTTGYCNNSKKPSKPFKTATFFISPSFTITSSV